MLPLLIGWKIPEKRSCGPGPTRSPSPHRLDENLQFEVTCLWLGSIIYNISAWTQILNKTPRLWHVLWWPKWSGFRQLKLRPSLTSLGQIQSRPATVRGCTLFNDLCPLVVQVQVSWLPFPQLTCFAHFDFCFCHNKSKVIKMREKKYSKAISSGSGHHYFQTSFDQPTFRNSSAGFFVSWTSGSKVSTGRVIQIKQDGRLFCHWF